MEGAGNLALKYRKMAGTSRFNGREVFLIIISSTNAVGSYSKSDFNAMVWEVSSSSNKMFGLERWGAVFFEFCVL